MKLPKARELVDSGAEQYIPFARQRLHQLRWSMKNAGIKTATQVFDLQDASIMIQLTASGTDLIRITGGSATLGWGELFTNGAPPISVGVMSENYKINHPFVVGPNNAGILFGVPSDFVFSTTAYTSNAQIFGAAWSDAQQAVWLGRLADSKNGGSVIFHVPSGENSRNVFLWPSLDGSRVLMFVGSSAALAFYMVSMAPQTLPDGTTALHATVTSVVDLHAGDPGFGSVQAIGVSGGAFSVDRAQTFAAWVYPPLGISSAISMASLDIVGGVVTTYNVDTLPTNVLQGISQPLPENGGFIVVATTGTQESQAVVSGTNRPWYAVQYVRGTQCLHFTPDGTGAILSRTSGVSWAYSTLFRGSDAIKTYGIVGDTQFTHRVFLGFGSVSGAILTGASCPKGVGTLAFWYAKTPIIPTVLDDIVMDFDGVSSYAEVPAQTILTLGIAESNTVVFETIVDAPYFQGSLGFPLALISEDGSAVAVISGIDQEQFFIVEKQNGVWIRQEGINLDPILAGFTMLYPCSANEFAWIGTSVGTLFLVRLRKIDGLWTRTVRNIGFVPSDALLIRAFDTAPVF